MNLIGAEFLQSVGIIIKCDNKSVTVRILYKYACRWTKWHPDFEMHTACCNHVVKLLYVRTLPHAEFFR